MPWKLVSFLFTLIIVTLFIGFNLEHVCDVSFIVHEFHNVPIFVSLLFAYVAGALTFIPFFLANRKNKKRKDLTHSGKTSAQGKKASVSSKSTYERDGGKKGTSARDFNID